MFSVGDIFNATQSVLKFVEQFLIRSAAGFSAASAFFDGKRAAFLDIVKMSGFDEERLTELLC